MLEARVVLHLTRDPRLLSLKLEGSGPPDGHGSLKYNSQSKRYVFCEDAPDATACSICLEVLGTTPIYIPSLLYAPVVNQVFTCILIFCCSTCG